MIGFCEELRVAVNVKRTKFLVINGDDNDAASELIRRIDIKYSCSYLYRGACFSDDSRMNTVLALL